MPGQRVTSITMSLAIYLRTASASRIRPVRTIQSMIKRRQGHGFAYLEDIIDPTSKISLILGAYQGSFQIPDSPGQTPAFQYLNQTNFNSALLNETQQESNDYAALSYLKTEDNYSFQISAFTRYSRLAYSPDPVGDLMFYGLAQNALRTDVAEGLQVDASYKHQRQPHVALRRIDHRRACSLEHQFPGLSLP